MNMIRNKQEELVVQVIEGEQYSIQVSINSRETKFRYKVLEVFVSFDDPSIDKKLKTIHSALTMQDEINVPIRHTSKRKSFVYSDH